MTTFDLLGHSMGGLVAFEYIKRLFETDLDSLNRINNVIALHSPINGLSCFASACSWLADLRLPTDTPAAIDMADMARRNTNFEVAHSNNDVAKKMLKAGTRFHHLASANDWAISFKDAYVPGYTTTFNLGRSTFSDPGGHSQILGSDSDEVQRARSLLRQIFSTTADPTANPSPIVPPNPSAPSATDNSSFTNIESPHNGAVFSPNQPFRKTWRVRNTGSRLWGPDHKLVFTSGRQMGGPKEISLPVIAPGEEVDIGVDLIAPSEPGAHQGYWRLRNPQGTFFGPDLRVDITVPATNSPPPPPGDKPAVEIFCSNCPATVPPGSTFRPTVQVIVNSGQLLQSRGDLLRHSGGELYGAHPHVAVVGVVNSGQPYSFTFYENDPIKAPDQEGTYESRWRVWQNGGWIGPELTIRFQVKASGGSNRPPNAPTLTGPGDWAVYTGNSGIILTAQHNGDPDGDAVSHYYFEIFESAQNANSGWITSNTWSPQGLGYNGYQWRAKVRDSRGAESGWSPQTWHFGVHTNEPQIYRFDYVACRQPWGDPEQLCFCADSNAGTLRLQVNRATDGSDRGEWQVLNELGVPRYDCQNDNDRPPTWTQLEYEAGAHLVRLYARRDGGWEAAASRDLIVSLPAERRPNSPREVAPRNRAYVNSRTVTLDWIDTLRTTSYRLQASDQENFASLLLDQTLPATESHHTHTFAQEYETVYWRIIAYGPYGQHEANHRFHIDTTPPASTVKELPLVTTDTKFNVAWSGSDARSGLRWYHLQVRDGNRAESTWSDWLVNTTKTAEIFSGLAGHTYYFRVRAMDNQGNWEEWPAGDGDTYTRVDPAAAPPTAWWHDGYPLKRNLVILNNDSDSIPAQYPVRLHFDGATNPTAAEIYHASLAPAKGDDLRLVYDNQTELPRFVQRFTASEIDIWFPMHARLGGGQSDSSSYQLYYGNSQAANPPADMNAVFLPKADQNTMGLWHLQEGSGGTAYDSSGRSHHGSFINPDWGEGYLGPAARFNGSSSYVEMGHSEDFRPGPITLEAWIYLSGSPGDYPMIFNKDRYWLRLTGDGKLQFMIKADGGDRSITGQTRLNLNQWYHIAATYDGGQRTRLYVNGRMDREKDDGAPPSQWNTHPLRIGRSDYNGASYFPGYIQHARLSNTERTDFSYGGIDIPPTIDLGSPMEPPVQGAPDLSVVALHTYPSTNGDVIVEAIVQNQGDRNTLSGFYTDLYIDHLPTGAGDYTGSIQFWVNSPIEPGALVTLTALLADLNVLGNVSAAETTAPRSETTHTLYAQADSAGVLNEAEKANNIYAQGVEVCFATPDAFEPDDTAGNAAQLVLGQVQARNFTTLGDQDWARFTAEAGKEYLLSTRNLGVAADTYLYLYAQDGVTLLAANDDADDSVASRIEWTAPATGTYYVLVRHWNPNVSGCGTGYDLIVENWQTPPTPTLTATPTPTSTPPTPTPTPTQPSGEADNVLFLPLVVQKEQTQQVPTPTPSPTATPTRPPASVGILAYSSTVDGNNEIYVMRSDGTGQINLTRHPAYDWGPSWSPDGSRIAFASARDGDLEIYIMEADGSNPTPLTHNDLHDVGPAWSPDGQWIAYKSYEDGRYFVKLVSPDGLNSQLLSSDANSDWRISWSPDSTQLAFSSFRDGNGEIYRIRVDGTGLTRLTYEPSEDNDAAWSPDGQHIAFVSLRDGNPEIYKMNIDGTAVTRLTNDPATDTIPYWSPDGQQIVFTSNREGFQAIYVMNADGSAPTRITSGPSDSNFAIWKPQ